MNNASSSSNNPGWAIPFFDLAYDQAEEQAVVEVLRSRWLTQGPRIRRFEEEMEALLGGGMQACAVANCTAALFMALHLAGAAPGREVVLPAVTFVAALNAVTMTGATPVLADCARVDTPNVTAETIRRAISPETCAVMVVHMAGMPCDMPEIVRLCEERGVMLIEDVAHAPGASLGDTMCGAFGHCSCFSFFSNKNIATGEGGMLCCKSSEHAEKARLLRSHGMTADTVARYQGRALTYDVALPGFNFRMDELRAALGLVQLAKLPAHAERRAALVQRYQAGLAATPLQPLWPAPLPDSSPAWHLMIALLPEGSERQAFMGWMRGQGVQTSVHYPAFEEFSFYHGRFAGQAPVAETYAARTVSLPLFPNMRDQDVVRVCDLCARYFRQHHQGDDA